MTAANSAPLVTVAICVYNARPYLAAALASVIAQTHRELEILVIDDGSTDGSLEAISGTQDPRVSIVQREHSGKAAALNYALSIMRGDYLAIQDADDISHDNRIGRLVRYAEAHPELAAVFSGHELLLGDRRVAPRFRSKSIEECSRDIASLRMPAHDPTGMFRRSAIGDLRFDESLMVCQQYDFILRLGERSSLAVIGECLYSYRVDIKSSATRSSIERREHFVSEVHRRALVRRGLNPATLASAKSAGSRDNNLAAHFMESCVDLRAAGRLTAALRTGLLCIRRSPARLHNYKALMYAVLPKNITRSVRARRQAARNSEPISA